ncbi:MAG: complex I NDUFA9 subunit family protein [bacterium]
MKKVLVTGATGFVGGHIVEELLGRGYEVSALVRSPEKAGGLGKRGVELRPGGILKPETLDFSGFDAVIHLVGIIREAGEQTFERVHYEGTVNVVEAAKWAGVKRYVHMSALGTRPGAKSNYHKTKFKAEEHVRGSGLPFVIFRPSVIFGERGEFTKMLADFFKNPFFVPVIGSGESRMQPVSVKDVAKLFADALANEKSVNRVFELGGPKAFTFNELLDEAGRQLGKKRFKLHMPMPVAFVIASVFEKVLAKPPLTRDQLIMLREDSVCDTSEAGEVFGIDGWEPFKLPG